MITLEQIHESFVNGQRSQAFEQIQEYGINDFVYEYESFLADLYTEKEAVNEYALDAYKTILRKLVK